MSFVVTNKIQQIMKNQIFNLEKNPLELKGLWPVDCFNEAYSKQSAFKGCALVSLMNKKNLEEVSLIVLRIFIEDTARAREDQKYVVGIRFYSFGDMATIDVISLDKGLHKEICYDHLKRMGWPSWNEQIGEKVNEFDETTRAPFLFVGGHLKIKSEKQAEFFGSSGDYGLDILFSDSNSIAQYVASASGIELGVGNEKKGESFVQEILQFMLKHKLNKDFYEKLIQETCQKTPTVDSSFSAQQIGAFVAMKVADRMLTENKDGMSLIVEEMCGGGIGRTILLESVAQRLRVKKGS